MKKSEQLIAQAKVLNVRKSEYRYVFTFVELALFIKAITNEAKASHRPGGDPTSASREPDIFD